MITTALLLNIVGGISASVLTLFGDRWVHRKKINRRLSRFAGDYRIVSIMPPRDTRDERVTIQHVDGLRFSITAAGGPIGNWIGNFVVSEEFFDVAHGVYRYPGSTDWGQHDLLFDKSTDSILVYGVNRSKPGLMDPFSFSLVRRRPNAPNVV
jgi:hypothetical protein